jgi:hemoglobin
MAKRANLFDRLGLEGASRISLGLYDRILQSDQIGGFFAGVDMQRLIEHQALFLSSIMGGPESHSDADLKHVHAPLAIDHESFELMLGMLREVLESENLPVNDVAAIVAAYTQRRPCIVTSRKRSGPRVA